MRRLSRSNASGGEFFGRQKSGNSCRLTLTSRVFIVLFSWCQVLPCGKPLLLKLFASAFSIDLHYRQTSGGEGVVQAGKVGAAEGFPAGEGMGEGFLALVEAGDQVGGGGGVGALDGAGELLEGGRQAAER